LVSKYLGESEKLVRNLFEMVIVFSSFITLFIFSINKFSTDRSSARNAKAPLDY